MDWYFKVLRNYAVFNGRARRKEFWIFVSYYLAGAIVLSIADQLLGSYLIPPVFDYPAGINRPGTGLLSTLYTLALIVPGLAVLVRRLHDSGHSGRWLLIGLIPIAGALILLRLLVRNSAPGSNRYGDNPKTAMT